MLKEWPCSQGSMKGMRTAVSMLPSPASFSAKHGTWLHPSYSETRCQTHLLIHCPVWHGWDCTAIRSGTLDSLFHHQVWATWLLFFAKNQCSFSVGYSAGPTSRMLQICRLPRFHSLSYWPCILRDFWFQAWELTSSPGSFPLLSEEQHLPLDSRFSLLGSQAAAWTCITPVSSWHSPRPGSRLVIQPSPQPHFSLYLSFA